MWFYLLHKPVTYPLHDHLWIQYNTTQHSTAQHSASPSTPTPLPYHPYHIPQTHSLNLTNKKDWSKTHSHIHTYIPIPRVSRSDWDENESNWNPPPSSSPSLLPYPKRPKHKKGESKRVITPRQTEHRVQSQISSDTREVILEVKTACIIGKPQVLESINKSQADFGEAVDRYATKILWDIMTSGGCDW